MKSPFDKETEEYKVYTWPYDNVTTTPLTRYLACMKGYKSGGTGHLPVGCGEDYIEGWKRARVNLEEAEKAAEEMFGCTTLK